MASGTLPSPAVVRDRLIGHLSQDDLVKSLDLPNPIRNYDTFSPNDQKTEVCFVVAGYDQRTDTLGPRGVGKVERKSQIVMIVYLFRDNDTDNVLPDQLMTLTNALTDAVWRYYGDPTPGSQLWYEMAFEGRPFNTTLHTVKTFYASVTPITLTSRTTRS